MVLFTLTFSFSNFFVQLQSIIDLRFRPSVEIEHPLKLHKHEMALIGIMCWVSLIFVCTQKTDIKHPPPLKDIADQNIAGASAESRGKSRKKTGDKQKLVSHE